MSTTPKAEWPTELPPHVNAEAHKRLMQRLAKMTPDELFQSCVEVGIYTPEGKLTERYAPKADDHLE
jgi:hypothetical protein